MQVENITAIILAAGYSSRMGDFKPLLRLGHCSVLERVIMLFKSAGLSDIRVVCGYRAADLSSLLQRLNIRPVLNERFDEGMFSSIRAGVKSLERMEGAFMLLPVDIPLVRQQTIHRLLREYRLNKGKIYYPCFNGERGHPPLISALYREEIACWNGAGGLRGLLEKHESEAINVETADENILFDIDTQADYRKLLDRWQRYGIPTIRECEVILNKLELPDKAGLISHCRAVASLAVYLAQEINQALIQQSRAETPDISDAGHLDDRILDLQLVAAAGLLHDLAKGRPEHASAGAQILMDMGFPIVAGAVAVHMDINVSENKKVDFKELVYLSDKLIQGAAVVLPEVRFKKMLEKHAGNQSVINKIERRWQNAVSIINKIEACTGKSIELLLAEREEKANYLSLKGSID
jgi:CTP:molybdopterin cytidylyltransferase MocA